MRVHQAAMGFDASADAYERGRPDYPEDAVVFLARQLGLAGGATVLDIGAGTGKLTRRLTATGARVIGLEPVAGMRRKFAQMLPAIEIIEAAAESIPLPGASLDAACAGQAFHWFANATALGEIRRVLKPHSRLGLIWNRMDYGSRWLSEIQLLINRQQADAPQYRDGEWRWVLDGFDGFEKTVEQAFSLARTSDLATVLDRFGSISYIAGLPTREREKILNQIRTILSTDPETAGRDRIELFYRTEVFIYSAR
jgi:SAM-dependent methyltransferase